MVEETLFCWFLQWNTILLLPLLINGFKRALISKVNYRNITIHHISFFESPIKPSRITKCMKLSSKTPWIAFFLRSTNHFYSFSVRTIIASMWINVFFFNQVTFVLQNHRTMRTGIGQESFDWLEMKNLNWYSLIPVKSVNWVWI